MRGWQMSSFGPCSQVGAALVLLFRTCHSSPASTRLEKELMVVQLDSTVFGVQEQWLVCPAVGVMCDLPYCMLYVLWC